MRQAGGGEGYTGRLAARSGALRDALALHVGHLRQHGQDELTDALCDATETTNFNRDATAQQLAHGGLHVERVPAQAIHGVNVDLVAFSDVLEQGGEAGALSSRDGTADAFVAELSVEGATEGLPLAYVVIPSE